MRYALVLPATAAMVCLFGLNNLTGAEESGKSGEAGFKEHCAVCHRNGGNFLNPQKTLHKSDLDANNVKTADDIISKMRNPGPRMTKFDTKIIPYSEAQKIAEYILETFK